LNVAGDMQGGCKGPEKGRQLVGRALHWVSMFSDGTYEMRPVEPVGADPLLEVKDALEALNGMLPVEKRVTRTRFYELLDDGRFGLESVGTRRNVRVTNRRVRLSSLRKVAGEISPKTGTVGPLN
jgi:hypothetical protein